MVSVGSVTNMSRISAREDFEKPLKFRDKCRWVFKNISVEPLMLCYILPSVMAGLALQNLNLEKACRVNLQYNETICDAMAARNASGYSQHEEIAVQKLVASMMALRNVFQSLFPCILLLFIGSWSDRHHRRLPCITLPILGEAIALIGFLICTYFFNELSIIYNVFFEGIPPGLTGGWFAMSLGVNAYISDISTVETRTVRIGALNLFQNISIPIGIALSGILYVKIGFYGVFSLSLLLLILGLLYGCFHVKEVPRKADDTINLVPKRNFFVDFFDFGHVRNTFRVAFKRGENNRRIKTVVCMILAMLIIGPLHGEMSVLYLFVRYKFGWNEVDYSVYLSVHFVTQILGTLFSLLFLSKYLKLDDSLIGIFACISKVLASIMYCLAPSGNYLYIGAVLESMHASSFIAMRAIISKMVPGDELGTFYSLYGVSEALMPLVYGPLYSMVYKSTIAVFPSTFFMVGAGLSTPAIFLFSWLYSQHRNQVKSEMKLNEAKERKILLKNNEPIIIYDVSEEEEI